MFRNYASSRIDNQLSFLLEQERFTDALLKAEQTLHNISCIKIVSFITILLCFEEFYLLSLKDPQRIEYNIIQRYLLDQVILFIAMLAFYISFDEDNINFLEQNIILLRTIADNQFNEDSLSTAHIIAKEIINEIDLLHYAQQLINKPQDENTFAKKIRDYLLANHYQKNREHLHFLKHYHPKILSIFIKKCINDFLNKDDRTFIFRILIQYDKNVLTKFLNNTPFVLRCPILQILPVIPVQIKGSSEEMYDLHSLKTLPSKTKDNNIKNHPLRLNTEFKISELIHLTKNANQGFLNTVKEKLNTLKKESNKHKNQGNLNHEIFKIEERIINNNYLNILSIDLINEKSYTKEVVGELKKFYFGEQNAFSAKFSIFIAQCLTLGKKYESLLNDFINQGAKTKINSPEIINGESHTALSLLTNGYIYNTQERPLPKLLTERINWLLRNGADINLHDDNNQSPLITAAKNSAQVLIRTFLEQQEPTLEILNSAINATVDPEIKNILEDYRHKNYLYDVFNNEYILRRESQNYLFSRITEKCIDFRNRLSINSLDDVQNSPASSPTYQIR